MRTALAELVARKQAGDDLDERVFITHRAVEWTEALRLAERLSAAHTATEGFRSLDLLHIGAAFAFRCGEFYSFDIAARRLATLAGRTESDAEDMHVQDF